MAKKTKEKNTPANRSKMPASRVVDLAELVTYGDGAIVSRVLLEGEAGTVTLFAFDDGQSLSEHTVPFDALVHVLDGEGEFIVGGKAHCAGAGQALLMPAHVPHAVKAARRFKMLLTMLKAKGKFLTVGADGEESRRFALRQAQDFAPQGTGAGR
jgi:quercetin dioxygenase-like cupin family protein